eukprot:SAG22_NODE_1431_length_4441_cov_1.510134_4_plen_153_part_00
MGKQVLNASLTGDGGAPVDEIVADSLHVYAHCGPATHSGEQGAARAGAGAGGAVALLFANVSPETEHRLTVPGGFGGSDQDSSGLRQEWHFTAPAVTSRAVSLNGKPLLLPAGDTLLPALPPKRVAADTAIVVQPLSYGFAILPGVRCPPTD